MVSIYEEARGISDEAILRRAHSENRILVTCDKDFGEKVYREKIPHHGIIYLRLKNQRRNFKIAAIEKLLLAYADQLADAFTVVTETQVRFGK